MNGKHIHLKWALTRDWWNATRLDMLNRKLTGVISTPNFSAWLYRKM